MYLEVFLLFRVVRNYLELFVHSYAIYHLVLEALLMISDGTTSTKSYQICISDYVCSTHNFGACCTFEAMLGAHHLSQRVKSLLISSRRPPPRPKL